MLEVDLPYFDQILEHVGREPDSELAIAFRRHVHWGCFEHPERADDSLEGYVAAAEAMTRRVVDAAGVDDGQQILDVGCGFGGTVDHLNERLHRSRLVGLNIDGRQLALARMLVTATPTNTVAFVAADACRLPVAAAAFDTVSAVECAFHFPSRRQFFREVARVLRPGGALTMSDFICGPEALTALAQHQQSTDGPRADFYGHNTKPLTSAGCPLCGGSSLVERVRVHDLLQFKPGEFELDECTACHHVFQNPRLSIEGLDFYYRDFYDGMGGEQLEFVFSSDDTSYRGRVDLVAAHARPTRWLDVGAGHGHFCLIASDVLPDTTFDGLDLSDGIVGAEQRGWIERAYVGLFPALADELRASYDVVSMHHYLERTREPADELDAAGKVLEPGGHLLVEVPDPECASGRLLGWLWGPWFQPQHQHFVSVANLAAMLDERGFTVVAKERGPAHQPVDLAFASLLLTNRIAGPPARPWRESPGRAARLRRTACFAVLAPFMVLALVLDRLIAPVVRRFPGGSNTYRLLARKDTDRDHPTGIAAG